MAGVKYYPGEPKEYTLKEVTDWINENPTGEATFDGTGAQTEFNIPHGLSTTPTSVQVTPGSAEAAALFYVSATSTNIVVTFTTAPASGTNNVILNWMASL